MYPGYAVTQKRDNVSNHLSFVPTSTVRNHDHVDLGVNGKKEFSNFEIQWAVRAQSIDRTIANGFHVLFNCVLSSSVRIFNAPFDESLCASTSRAVLVMTNEAVVTTSKERPTNELLLHTQGVCATMNFWKKKVSLSSCLPRHRRGSIKFMHLHRL